MKLSIKAALFLASAPVVAFVGLQTTEQPPASAAATPADAAELHLQPIASLVESGPAGHDRLALEADQAPPMPKATDPRRRKASRSLGKGQAAAPTAVAPAAVAPASAGAPQSATPPLQAEAAPLRTNLGSSLPQGRTPLPKEDGSEKTVFAFGLGRARFPSWMGAATHKNFNIPYININWRDRVEFSTNNGLIVDLIHKGPWHGGLVGTMIWGRSNRDLGSLRVPTLSNTLQGGAYLEYAVTPALSVGVRVRHDIQSTGSAYADIYADLDLPSPGVIEHSVRIAAEAMNRAAADRFFGISEATAAGLGTSPYRAKSGYSQVSVAYDLFVPTSPSTGFALGAAYGRLGGSPANSPLVRDFGSPNQRTVSASFVYHF